MIKFCIRFFVLEIAYGIVDHICLQKAHLPEYKYSAISLFSAYKHYYQENKRVLLNPTRLNFGI